MKEAIELLTQIAIAVPGIVALIIAWKALKISQNAQRNTIRESVFQWQFEAIREIHHAMNGFLDCYMDYEIDAKYPDFVEIKRHHELDQLAETYGNAVEKYEFILPVEIYDPLSRLASIFDTEVTNLGSGEKVKGFDELFSISNNVTPKLTDMFGIEELSHENKKLIDEYAKRAQE
jgi:hypothetical protein